MDLSINTVVGKPVCCDYYTDVNIVSTTASLADVLNDNDAKYYSATGKTFEFLGPLLFSSSEKASKQQQQATVATAASMESVDALFQRVDDAIAAGRHIVYVSLGTVLTSAKDKVRHTIPPAFH